MLVGKRGNLGGQAGQWMASGDAQQDPQWDSAAPTAANGAPGWVSGEETGKRPAGETPPRGPGNQAVSPMHCWEVWDPWVVVRLGRGQGNGGGGDTWPSGNCGLATVLGVVGVTQFQVIPQRELRLLIFFLS